MHYFSRLPLKESRYSSPPGTPALQGATARSSLLHRAPIQTAQITFALPATLPAWVEPSLMTQPTHPPIGIPATASTLRRLSAIFPKAHGTDRKSVEQG